MSGVEVLYPADDNRPLFVGDRTNVIGSRRFTMWIEDLLDRMGLLKPFGSPVTLVAERCAP